MDPISDTSVDDDRSARRAHWHGRVNARFLAIIAVVATTLTVSIILATGSSGRPVDVSTPEGSLRAMQQAVKAGDWATAGRYIDVEAVSAAYVGTLMSNALGAEDDQADSPGSGREHRSTGQQGTSSSEMSSAFAQRVEQALEDAVESKRLDGDSRASGLWRGELSSSRPLTDGRISVVVKTRDDDPALTVTMSRVNERWMIVSVEGLRDLFDLVR